MSGETEFNNSDNAPGAEKMLRRCHYFPFLSFLLCTSRIGLLELEATESSWGTGMGIRPMRKQHTRRIPHEIPLTPRCPDAQAPEKPGKSQSSHIDHKGICSCASKT